MSYLASFPSDCSILVKLSFLTGVPHLHSFIEGEPWTLDYEIWLKKPATSLYQVVHNIFQYVELFKSGSPV